MVINKKKKQQSLPRLSRVEGKKTVRTGAAWIRSDRLL